MTHPFSDDGWNNYRRGLSDQNVEQHDREWEAEHASERIILTQPIPYEGMVESDYREETQPRATRVAIACAALAMIITVCGIMQSGFANAAPVQQSTLPAATLQLEDATTYPGGDPLKEISAEFGSLDIFGSLGSQPEDPKPPQGELPLLDDPQSVSAFCDESAQVTIQVAGAAPLSGLYLITFSPTDELTFTLLNQYIERGEKVQLVEPAPAGADVRITLQMPAQPDDTASPFTGTIVVKTPVCG